MSMEFGLFIGGWVPDYLDGRNDAYEHQRLIDETASPRRATASTGSTRGSPSTTSSRSTRTSRPTRCSCRTSLARTEQHPRRLGDHQRHAAGEPPGPRRRAGRDARPPLGAAASSSAPAAARRPPSRAASASPTPSSPRTMFDEVIGEFRKMWSRRTYSFDGQFFSMPERNVLPKPYVKPHPPMWVAAGNPDTFEKAGEAGPRRPVLHRRLAREDGAARRDLQEARSRTRSRSAST